ncbi:hypothetical protein CRUP_003663 [Coryphaenoides rupestris]|nr:hypothetical protein CRUP_003663 [Coryphaenoides rupestris]
MNDLCSRFLEVLDSEVDTFWSFSCCMEKFSKDFRADGLHRKIAALLKDLDPELHDHLVTEGMESFTFCHSPGRHRVILGEHDRQSTSEQIQVISIDRAITHPYYNTQNFNNDITLLRLSSPAHMTSHVSPVCLASSSPPTGTRCVTTGWGRTGQTSSPRYLQQTALPLLSSAQCRQYWGQNKITDAMICAGASGVNCNVRTPAVYSHVSYLRRWVDQVVSSN